MRRGVTAAISGIVRDQHDRAAFGAELAEQSQDGFAGVRIEVARGFIRENDLGDC